MHRIIEKLSEVQSRHPRVPLLGITCFINIVSIPNVCVTSIIDRIAIFLTHPINYIHSKLTNIQVFSYRTLLWLKHLLSNWKYDGFPLLPSPIRTILTILIISHLSLKHCFEDWVHSWSSYVFIFNHYSYLHLLRLAGYSSDTSRCQKLLGSAPQLFWELAPSLSSQN